MQGQRPQNSSAPAHRSQSSTCQYLILYTCRLSGHQSPLGPPRADWQCQTRQFMPPPLQASTHDPGETVYKEPSTQLGRFSTWQHFLHCPPELCGGAEPQRPPAIVCSRTHPVPTSSLPTLLQVLPHSIVSGCIQGDANQHRA